MAAEHRLRFTHQGIALLFGEAGFSRVDVYPVDGKVISRLQQFNIYHKFKRVPGFVKIAAALDRPRLGRATTMHFLRAEKSHLQGA